MMNNDLFHRTLTKRTDIVSLFRQMAIVIDNQTNPFRSNIDDLVTIIAKRVNETIESLTRYYIYAQQFLNNPLYNPLDKPLSNSLSNKTIDDAAYVNLITRYREALKYKKLNNFIKVLNKIDDKFIYKHQKHINNVIRNVTKCNRITSEQLFKGIKEIERILIEFEKTDPDGIWLTYNRYIFFLWINQ